MNIRAVFNQGDTALTVHGLTQWDYGRKLEISHPSLPGVVEVHFAVVGAQEAAVRVVAGVAGVAEAPIPDELLEQPRAIMAWVYVVSEESGETMLTVTMPVQTRARPTAAGPVPEPLVDKYTEALGAMNEQVAALREGNVIVAKALVAEHADSAEYATNAMTAKDATRAEVAGRAEKADLASQATNANNAESAEYAKKASFDIQGNPIHTTYLKPARGEWLTYSDSTPFSPVPGTVYQFCVAIGDYDFITAISYNVAKKTRTALGSANVKLNANENYNLNLTLQITELGKVEVIGHGPNSGGFVAIPASAITGIYYRTI